MMCGQAVVVYDWRAGKRCKSFQGHSREITKVKAQLGFILEQFSLVEKKINKTNIA